MSIDLPALNAVLNGCATLLLSIGYYMIRTGNITAHRRCMVGAFVLSVLFLVSYVSHRIIVKGVHTPFQGEGLWKAIYYPILLTHVLLAMVIVPLVLRTLYLALRGRFQQHRRWARWTFPIWYYVSITGVLVYFFLYVWF